MSSDHSKGNPQDGASQTGAGLKRRDLLLRGTSLLAASALAATGFTGTAHAQQQAPAPPAGAAAEHCVHHGRRHRLVQRRRLPPGHDVRQDAKPRQAGLAGHAVHRLLRRSQLHGGPGRLHHRRNSAAHGPHDGRPGRRRRRHASPGLHDCNRAQGAGLCHRAIRQESSRRSEQVPADAARLR